MNRFWAGLAAVAVSAGMVVAGGLSAGAATTPTPPPTVGGGAAGVQVGSTVFDTALFSPILSMTAPVTRPIIGYGRDGIQVTAAFPTVTLPPNGSDDPITASALGRTVGPVTVGVFDVSTHGTTAGTPYAESSTDILGVHIPGSDISAIRTHCVWDQNGARGETEVAYANRPLVAVPANTGLEIPGVGHLFLNAQQFDTYYGGNQTIVVVGAELVLNQPNGDGFQTPQATTVIQLGFTSCDPLIPPLIIGIIGKSNST